MLDPDGGRGGGVTTDMNHQRILLLMHQVYFCGFQINSNFGCGCKKYLRQILEVEIQLFNLFHVFLSK